jgi:phosphoribosyl-ATP pyrophosphohydrolase
MTDILEKLGKVIEQRRGANPKNSYVAKLFKKGTGKICQKIGEEATEVVVAALSEKKKHVISESADLLFHLSMLWADKGIKPSDVMDELDSRMGISGLDEKAARKADKREANE